MAAPVAEQPAAMRHWIVKSEPDSYSWDDLVRDGATEWDGVRNHAAAGHLRAMSVGDPVLFYHSGAAKAAVGVARVSRAAQADGPTDQNWVSVEIAPDHPLAHPVALATMRGDPALAGLAMIRQSRLSVSPASADEWQTILTLAEKPE